MKRAVRVVIFKPMTTSEAVQIFKIGDVIRGRVTTITGELKSLGGLNATTAHEISVRASLRVFKDAGP